MPVTVSRPADLPTSHQGATHRQLQVDTIHSRGRVGARAARPSHGRLWLSSLEHKSCRELNAKEQGFAAPDNEGSMAGVQATRGRVRGKTSRTPGRAHALDAVQCPGAEWSTQHAYPVFCVQGAVFVFVMSAALAPQISAGRAELSFGGTRSEPDVQECHFCERCAGSGRRRLPELYPGKLAEDVIDPPRPTRCVEARCTCDSSH